jgi:hypothetical protein
VDSIAVSFVSDLVACVGSEGFVGDSSDYYTAYSQCGYSYYFYGSFGHDCGCVQTDGDVCYEFSGGIVDGGDCKPILNEYKSALQATVAFDVLTTLSVIVLCVLTCMSLCRCGPQVPQSSSGGTGGGSIAMSTLPSVLDKEPMPQQQPAYVAVVAGEDAAVATRLA